MRQLDRFVFAWLTMALVAELVTYTRLWSLPDSGVVVLVTAALSVPLVPIIRRHALLKAFLALMMTALSLYIVILPAHDPAADTLDLMLTALLWRCLFEDEGPQWKSHLTQWAGDVGRTLSRPVMPLP